ncbi:unnamed protein product [Rhizoctonia solani]|nr:unnamed protein product [Rhizoctonia solani]
MESDLSVPRSYLAYQTALFFVVRGALFYICRFYLIRSLYKLSPITQSNSAALAPGSPLTTPTTPRSSSRVGDSYFELGNIPVPNVTRSHPRSSVARWGLGPTSVARSAFALCFSESCSLFLLVMCQAYDIMSPTSRYVNWRISLMTLVVLILLVIPVLQCLFVAYRPGKFDIGVSLSRRLALPLFFFSAYALLLLRIPLVGNNKDMDTLTAALMRLSVLGTVVLGTLSGFGAITTAWMFAGALGKKRWEGITKQDIASAEHSLTRVRNDLDLRNRESQALELQNTKNPQPRSWGSRFLGAFGGESVSLNLQKQQLFAAK